MNWKKGYFRLFISHISSAKPEATELAKILKDRFAVDAFVAHKTIKATADWQDEIEEALKSAHAFLAMLSYGFSKSYWCNQELGWALGLNSLVISLRAGEDPKGFVGRVQGLAGVKDNVPKTAERIFKVLASHKKTAAKMALIQSMRLRDTPPNSSWAVIEHYIGPQLERCNDFSDRALDILEDAFRKNSDVSTSYHLGKVKEILTTHGRTVPKYEP